MNISECSTQELRRRQIELLAYGVIPLENWVSVFVNPDLLSMPGLRAKAFSIWFPTMIDYLQGNEEFQAVKKGLEARSGQMDDVASLYVELSAAYKAILALYTLEEQLFIRDRRLQNVHGRLQLNTYEEHKPYLFCTESMCVTRLTFTAAQYTSIMERYYVNLRETSINLIERLVSSEEFVVMSELYGSKLRVSEYFTPLINKYGLSAACGDS